MSLDLHKDLRSESDQWSIVVVVPRRAPRSRGRQRSRGFLFCPAWAHVLPCMLLIVGSLTFFVPMSDLALFGLHVLTGSSHEVSVIS